MKHDELRSVAHNAAASIASGCSLLTGFYDLDVYGDSSRSGTGVTIDFLSGSVHPQPQSDELVKAAAAFPAILPRLCEKHGIDLSDFRDMQACYQASPLGGSFTVTVTDRLGKTTETDYTGWDGHRKMSLDEAGRMRPMPVRRMNTTP